MIIAVSSYDNKCNISSQHILLIEISESKIETAFEMKCGHVEYGMKYSNPIDLVWSSQSCLLIMLSILFSIATQESNANTDHSTQIAIETIYLPY